MKLEELLGEELYTQVKAKIDAANANEPDKVKHIRYADLSEGGYLSKEKHESVISKQIIRSGTSIGANANEAVYGVSKSDFTAKLQISLKETAETEYWLKLLVLSEYLTEQEGKPLIDDCLELKRILIATLKTAKEKK